MASVSLFNFQLEIFHRPWKEFLYKSLLTKLFIVQRSMMIDKKPWNCSMCESASFSKFSQLAKHRQEHHVKEDSATNKDQKQTSMNETNKNEDQNFKCKVCQKLFPDESLLESHSCTGRPAPKIYRCKTCPKEFLYMCKLVQHEKIHVMDKPYKCVVCYCSFSHACHLGRHMMTHSASANNKCIVCSKVFKTLALLQKHKLIHNSERVFKCDLCPETFQDLSQLTTHLVQHEKEVDKQPRQLNAVTAKPKSKKKRVARIDRKLIFRTCKAKTLSSESNNRLKRRPREAPQQYAKEEEKNSVSKTIKTSSTKCERSAVKNSLKKSKIFCCKICKKTFNKKGELNTHHRELHKMKKTPQIGINCELLQTKEAIFKTPEVFKVKKESEIEPCKLWDANKKEKTKVETLPPPSYPPPPAPHLFASPLRLPELCTVKELLEVKNQPELHTVTDQKYVCKICQQVFICSNLYDYHVKTHEDKEKKTLHNGVNGQSILRPSLFEKFDTLSPLEDSRFKNVLSLSEISPLISIQKPEQILTPENHLLATKTLKYSSQTRKEEQGFIDGHFKCLICNESFSTSFILDLHLEKHIIVKIWPRNRHTIWSIRFPQKRFCCKICQKSFSQRTILKGHFKVMHQGRNKKLFGK